MEPCASTGRTGSAAGSYRQNADENEQQYDGEDGSDIHGHVRNRLRSHYASLPDPERGEYPPSSDSALASDEIDTSSAPSPAVSRPDIAAQPATDTISSNAKTVQNRTRFRTAIHVSLNSAFVPAPLDRSFDAACRMARNSSRRQNTNGEDATAGSETT